METFKKMHNEFNYSFQKKIYQKKSVRCVIPKPTGKARSVKSITWSAGADVTAKATLATNYDSTYAVWEILKDNTQVSPSVTAIEFTNPTTYNRDVFVWVVME